MHSENKTCSYLTILMSKLQWDFHIAIFHKTMESQYGFQNSQWYDSFGPIFSKSIQIILFPSKWKDNAYFITIIHFTVTFWGLGSRHTRKNLSWKCPTQCRMCYQCECGGTRRGTSLSVLWHNKGFLGFDFQRLVIGWLVFFPPPNSYVEVPTPSTSDFIYIWRQSLKR